MKFLKAYAWYFISMMFWLAVLACLFCLCEFMVSITGLSAKDLALLITAVALFFGIPAFCALINGTNGEENFNRYFRKIAWWRNK